MNDVNVSPGSSTSPTSDPGRETVFTEVPQHQGPATGWRAFSSNPVKSIIGRFYWLTRRTRSSMQLWRHGSDFTYTKNSAMGRSDCIYTKNSARPRSDFMYTKSFARPRSDFIYTKNSARPRSDFIYTKNSEQPGSDFIYTNCICSKIFFALRAACSNRSQYVDLNMFYIEKCSALRAPNC